jgi:hypothetical protein
MPFSSAGNPSADRCQSAGTLLLAPFFHPLEQASSRLREAFRTVTFVDD